MKDILDLFEPSGTPLLSVLSMGAGQDSTALLYKYIYDIKFKERYAPKDFLVVMADTGNEFDQTYEHVEHLKATCVANNIEFVFLSKDKGYHTGDWQSLPEFFEAKSAIASKAYPKICSQRLKIDPIYRFLEDYLSDKYGVRKGKKSGIRQFAKEHGKIQMIIGIAAKEEKRMSSAADNKAKWYRESIEHVYPLVDMQMDRSKCQDYIRSTGHAVPIPSNCKMCPFLSEEELEYLRRFESKALEEWVHHEKRKLDKWKHLEAVPVVTKKGTKYQNKNLGVWGTKYLPEMISIVKDKFQHISDEQIIEYRMSHGHCVATTF